VDALKALLVGRLLDRDMKPLVIAALGSSYAGEVTAIEQAGQSDEEIEVLQVDLEALKADGVTLVEVEEPEECQDAGEAELDD
jgi:hypothetical protein